MDGDSSIALLYCPFPDLDSARAAAQTLLVEKLVACCNLLPGLESHYAWEGTLTCSPEVLLLCKTTQAGAMAVQSRLSGLHPYDCPAILTFEAHANAPFAAWVHANTNL